MFMPLLDFAEGPAEGDWFSFSRPDVKDMVGDVFVVERGCSCKS
jgi:hypothetical protein